MPKNTKCTITLVEVSPVNKTSNPNSGNDKAKSQNNARSGTAGAGTAKHEVQRLSVEAHDRLQSELTDLTGRGRIDIAHRIEQARLLGDLKENGDYHAAKEEQGKMEGRIRKLETLLKYCEVLDENEAQDDPEKVSPGVVVELQFHDEPTSVRLLFGSTEERHAEGLDVVSAGSPMGQALEGAAAGDTVSYQAGGSELSVKVIALGR